MDAESELLKDYRRQSGREYQTEVVVGNFLFQQSDLVPDAAAGASAGAIDALHTPINENCEQLVEAKTSIGFRGLGQLLLYTYFRRRDREIVREKYSQTDGWETEASVGGFEHHVIRRGGQFHARPAIDDVEQVLLVPEIPVADTLRLSAYTNLGVTIEYQSNGGYRTLDGTVFETKPGTDRRLTTDWLNKNSRDSLGSATEEALLEDAIELFGDTQVFREVPIGTHLYSGEQTPLRADAVIRFGNYWFVAEVKNTSNDRARTEFQRSVGQSVGYANLFAREWGIPPTQVAPVVIQDPLALAGGIYREDRYGEDYQAMRGDALSAARRPIVLGPPQRYQ